MKKTFAALSVLLALAAGVMFTGCERLQEIFDEVKEEVEGPKNQWQKCEVDYNYSGQTIKLNCFVLYSEDGYTNSEMKFKGVNPAYDKENPGDTPQSIDVTKLDPGLTICIQPKIAAAEATAEETNLIQTFFNSSVKCFAVKTFPKDSAIEGEDGESKFKANATTWTLLYNVMKETFGAEKKGLPVVLNEDSYNDYGNIELGEGGVSWETIAAALILSKLTDK